MFARSSRSCLLGVLLFACEDADDSEAAGGGSGGAGGEPTSASVTTGVSGAGGEVPACDVNAVDLIVSSYAGVPDRFHVPVRWQGADAALLFDTGSALTFVFLGPSDPDFVPEAGEVELGCDVVPVPGRGGLADFGDIDGLPVVGILGVDYVAAGTTLVDHDAGVLTRHPAGAVLPETAAWSKLAYDDVEGHMIAPVELDASPVRLMFDTGAPHIVWLGQQGQPGDQEVTTTDAEGNVLTFYYGSVALGMAGEPVADVPVLRAPSFPYLEATVAALGGDIHGLLGLSALDGRRFAIDGLRRAVLIEPR